MPWFQFRGFYKGVMSPVTGQAFVNAIVFGVHGNILKHITDDQTSISANFIAGFAAGEVYPGNVPAMIKFNLSATRHILH